MLSVSVTFPSPMLPSVAAYFNTVSAGCFCIARVGAYLATPAQNAMLCALRCFRLAARSLSSDTGQIPGWSDTIQRARVFHVNPLVRVIGPVISMNTVRSSRLTSSGPLGVSSYWNTLKITREMLLIIYWPCRWYGWTTFSWDAGGDWIYHENWAV